MQSASPAASPAQLAIPLVRRNKSLQAIALYKIQNIEYILHLLGETHFSDYRDSLFKDLRLGWRGLG